MRAWRRLIATAALLLAACDGSNTAGTSEGAAPPMPTGQLGDAVVPTHYDLDLTILPEKEDFSGRVAIDVEINRPSPVIWLHGMALKVSEAWLEAGGKRIEATYEEADKTGVVKLTLASVPPKGPGRLHFVYTAPFNDALEGLYKVTDGGLDYAFTQFEATSARWAFPGFDEPAFKTPFDIAVTAHEDAAVITTTPETGVTPAGEGLVKRTFATTPPLPTYLIAFAVGPLDVVEAEPLPPTEIRDHPLPLRGVATKGKGKQLAYALEHARGIIETEEGYFRIAFPYPKLDLIAVPDFAAGAMENVGAITFREQLLLLDDSASLGRKRAYASVMAHELAHQWFGDLVTPKWWDDIWLNESFATWMGNKTLAMWQPGQGFENGILRGALGVMHADELVSARQIRQPIRSNHDIATAFDSITYQKGAAVLAMFESWLGEEAFRKGVQLHLRRFADGVADVNDFLQSLAEGAERPDVVDAFKSFLFQPGVPLVSAALSCDNAEATVALMQARYLPLGSTGDRKQTWQIPVCLAYDGKEGRARYCTLLDSEEASIRLPDDHCPAWLMPNANANGYYRFSLDAAGWSALSGHLDALNDREEQSLLDSLAAAYHSGNAATATLVDAFRAFAPSPKRAVATMPLGELRTMHDRLAADAAAAAGIEAFVRELYGPRLAALGLASRPGERTNDALLRPTLVSALADLGQDETLRATLKEKALAYLASDPVDSSAIDPALVGIALRVAVAEEDADFARRLLDRALGSRDAIFRQRALGALASSPDPAVGAMMRELIPDPRLRDNEAIMIVFGQVGTKEQRDAIWDWTKSHLDQLLPRIPTWRKGAVVNVGAGFCSDERADEIESFFRDKVEALEGGPRELDQTVERIRLCAAFKAARSAEVTDYFSAR